MNLIFSVNSLRPSNILPSSEQRIFFSSPPFGLVGLLSDNSEFVVFATIILNKLELGHFAKVKFMQNYIRKKTGRFVRILSLGHFSPKHYEQIFTT